MNSSSARLAIDYDDVVAAHDRLQGVAHRTPVATSQTANDLTGAQLFFKCENFQRMGTFKFRGAFNDAGVGRDCAGMAA